MILSHHIGIIIDGTHIHLEIYSINLDSLSINIDSSATLFPPLPSLSLSLILRCHFNYPAAHTHTHSSLNIYASYHHPLCPSLLVFFAFLMPLFVLSPPSSRRCRRQRQPRRSWHTVCDSGRLPKGFRRLAVSYSVPQLMRQTSVRTQSSSSSSKQARQHVANRAHTQLITRCQRIFQLLRSSSQGNKYSGNMLLTSYKCCRSHALSLTRALSTEVVFVAT